MFKQEQVIQKINKLVVFQNMEKYISTLSNEIIIFLGEEIEELNVSSSIFRTGIQKSIRRLMLNLNESNSNLVINTDGIPGFTVLAYKKDSSKSFDSIEVVNDSDAENEVIYSVINRYLVKNKKRVIMIDNEDLRLVLFPVSDTKKNLKELDLYIVM